VALKTIIAEVIIRVMCDAENVFKMYQMSCVPVDIYVLMFVLGDVWYNLLLSIAY